MRKGSRSRSASWNRFGTSEATKAQSSTEDKAAPPPPPPPLPPPLPPPAATKHSALAVHGQKLLSMPHRRARPKATVKEEPDAEDSWRSRQPRAPPHHEGSPKAAKIIGTAEDRVVGCRPKSMAQRKGRGKGMSKEHGKKRTAAEIGNEKEVTSGDKKMSITVGLRKINLSSLAHTSGKRKAPVIQKREFGTTKGQQRKYHGKRDGGSEDAFDDNGKRKEAGKGDAEFDGRWAGKVDDDSHGKGDGKEGKGIRKSEGKSECKGDEKGDGKSQRKDESHGLGKGSHKVGKGKSDSGNQGKVDFKGKGHKEAGKECKSDASDSKGAWKSEGKGNSKCDSKCHSKDKSKDIGEKGDGRSEAKSQGKVDGKKGEGKSKTKGKTLGGKQGGKSSDPAYLRAELARLESMVAGLKK